MYKKKPKSSKDLIIKFSLNIILSAGFLKKRIDLDMVCSEKEKSGNSLASNQEMIKNKGIEIKLLYLNISGMIIKFFAEEARFELAMTLRSYRLSRSAP